MTKEKFEEKKKAIAALKTQITELKKNYVSKNYPNLPKKEVKADVGEMDDSTETEDSMDCCPPKDDYLYYMVDVLYRYIESVSSDLWRYQWQHQEGHLPPIIGAEKLTNALKALGLEKDYEVKKPVIYASASEKRGKTFLM